MLQNNFLQTQAKENSVCHIINRVGWNVNHLYINYYHFFNHSMTAGACFMSKKPIKMTHERNYPRTI